MRRIILAVVVIGLAGSASGQSTGVGVSSNGNGNGNGVIFGTTGYQCTNNGTLVYSTVPCPTNWDTVIRQLETRRDALTATIDLLKKEKTR